MGGSAQTHETIKEEGEEGDADKDKGESPSASTAAGEAAASEDDGQLSQLRSLLPQGDAAATETAAKLSSQELLVESEKRKVMLSLWLSITEQMNTNC